MTQPEHNWVHNQIHSWTEPKACYQSTKQTQPVTTIAFDQSAKVDHFTSSAVWNKHILVDFPFHPLTSQPAEK